MPREKTILLVDMESFYASVETARNTSLRGKPVVVCGDPQLRRGIILAASKEAKAYGIKTGMPAGEAKNLCPPAIFVRPHMKLYIEVSITITGLLSQFTDRVFAYSIDEQFLDMSGCEKLFGSPQEMAASIKEKIWQETGIRARVGIGQNPLQAKMACDRFAKKKSSGIFKLSHENYPHLVWPLPVKDLFGVGGRMEHNFQRMGIRTIGHLALLPREKLKRRWGINGEVLWLNANGLDYSVVDAMAPEEQKSVGHSMTLPRDYADFEEIKTVLLELTEEVCRRARAIDKTGRVVHLYCQGADFTYPAGFAHQKKLPAPTASAIDIYPILCAMFQTYWNFKPIRKIGVELSKLENRKCIQLSLLEDRERKMALDDAADLIKKRFGSTSLFRLSSLTSGGQLFQRSNKIGGHEA